MLLGIDIGGTNVKLGVYDYSFKLKNLIKEKTKNFPTFEFFANYIQILIKQYRIKAIGIGAPNGNFFTGKIHNPPNLGWKGVIDVVNYLEDRFQLPVVLTNDANAIAYAELKFGYGKDYSDFIVITLGTGLGSGIIVNGKLLNGANGFAGELGHIPIVPDGRLCSCGKKGCLESYVSIRGIKQTYKELSNHNDISLKQLSALAQKGDKIAKLTFEITGKYLGYGLASYIQLFDGQAIIVYGGIANAWKFMENSFILALEKNILENFRNRIKIHISKFQKTEGATLGAAALVFFTKLK